MTCFTPTTEQETLDIVRWATGEEAPLEVRGHGSKEAIGRPLQTEHVIDLSRLAGVTLYEPEELVLSAKAGTPLAELERLLAENGQEFAFEPMDYGPLLGEAPGRGTLGGLFATNLSGPRRIRMGAARDHVLGIRAVTGRGDVVKSGGRVVKNVTGYDLSKGLAGSWGTLAVATELTFKVLPRPETEETLVVSGLEESGSRGTDGRRHGIERGSLRRRTSAGDGPPAFHRRRVRRTGDRPAHRRLRAVRGGARRASLPRCSAQTIAVERLEAEISRRLWREIRDVRPYADGTSRPVWRVSMAPGDGHRLVAALRMEAGVDAFYDWQGGLVWMRMEGDPEAELVRRTIEALGGGHATLVRADPGMRAAVPVFHPQAPALHALAKRLKEQFDPHAILNPGRMVADI